MLCYSLSVLDFVLQFTCAFAELDLVSSVLCLESGYEEHLQKDLFCVKWNVKH